MPKTNETNETRETYRRHGDFEDEIYLIDYLRVIWKWKWLIILGTFVCMVVAGVVSFRMPEVYEVSTTIEPGIVGEDNEGNFMYIDSTDNIKGKIKRGLYNRRIQEALGLNPLETVIEIKVGSERGANFIKASSEWKETKAELGQKTLSLLLAFLSEDYKNIVEQRKGDYEKQVLMKQNQIKEIETQRKDIDKQILIKLNEIEHQKNDIKLNEANLKIIRERQKTLLQEIKNVKDNTEDIIRQRNDVLQHKGNGDDISLLLYSTVIQQNVAYFNQLSNQINDLMRQEKAIEAGIEKLNKDIININTEIERIQLKRAEGLQAKITDLNVQIDRLKLKKGIISNIKIIQQPEVSPRPVKPQKKMIIVLAGVVAFMMMLFLAFFIEYIKNAAQSTRERKQVQKAR